MKKVCCLAVMVLLGFVSIVAEAQSKPNILVIWGDDVGQSNISAFTRGVMGFRTPNIDRIAREGIIFTDYYGEQSRTHHDCSPGQDSPNHAFAKVEYRGRWYWIEDT